MGKFLVRVSVIAVGVYFLLSHIFAQFLGIDIRSNLYVLLFELLTVVYCCSEGKYHCKYIKYTAIALFISDALVRLDFAFNFLSVTLFNLVPITILTAGIGISLIKAITHFIKVFKIKYGRKQSVSNSSVGVISH